MTLRALSLRRACDPFWVPCTGLHVPLLTRARRGSLAPWSASCWETWPQLPIESQRRLLVARREATPLVLSPAPARDTPIAGQEGEGADVAVASVVGHTFAGRAVVLDARFVPPSACCTATASLARHHHNPSSTTVADAAVLLVHDFIGPSFFAAAALPMATGARPNCAGACAGFLSRFVESF